MKMTRRFYEAPQTESLEINAENFLCASENYDSSTLGNYEVDEYDFSDFLL